MQSVSTLRQCLALGFNSFSIHDYSLGLLPVRSVFFLQSCVVDSEFQLQRTCYVAMNPSKEENTKTESASYMLPDGNVIEVCTQCSISENLS